MGCTPLTVYNSELIAGGWFTSAGGVEANRIAKWNGTSWSGLGSGMDERVYALTVYNNELIAGGWFNSAGGVGASRIAKWNGTAWSGAGQRNEQPCGSPDGLQQRADCRRLVHQRGQRETRTTSPSGTALRGRHWAAG